MDRKTSRQKVGDTDNLTIAINFKIAKLSLSTKYHNSNPRESLEEYQIDCNKYFKRKVRELRFVS